MSNEIVKTVDDCRTTLAELINEVREGKTTPAALNSIINGFWKIFTSIKLEMEYNKAVGTTPHIDFIKGNKKVTKKLAWPNSNYS